MVTQMEMEHRRGKSSSNKKSKKFMKKLIILVNLEEIKARIAVKVWSVKMKGSSGKISESKIRYINLMLKSKATKKHFEITIMKK